MKRLFSLLVMLFFTTVLLSACSKKDKDVQPSNPNGTGNYSNGTSSKPVKTKK